MPRPMSEIWCSCLSVDVLTQYPTAAMQSVAAWPRAMSCAMAANRPIPVHHEGRDRHPINHPGGKKRLMVMPFCTATLDAIRSGPSWNCRCPVICSTTWPSTQGETGRAGMNTVF